jgi:hypothetical protein
MNEHQKGKQGWKGWFARIRAYMCDDEQRKLCQPRCVLLPAVAGVLEPPSFGNLQVKVTLFLSMFHHRLMLATLSNLN